MNEQQEARYTHFVTVRLERAVRDRLQRHQSRMQLQQDRYVSLSDAAADLLDRADQAEADAL